MIVVVCDECLAVAHHADVDDWLRDELLPDRHFCSVRCRSAARLRERIAERRAEPSGLGVRIGPL